MEIVIPTFDEERRIGNLLRYYGGLYDIVLLDDSSTDRTVAMAIEAGATVFRRLGKEQGEAYFVHYANELTTSGLCFHLFADEFIETSELEKVCRALKSDYAVAKCSKAEWMYGRRMLTFNHVEQRGFRKGYAQYDPDRLHASLGTIEMPPDQICPQLFALDHLQIWSVRGLFGKVGVYCYTEVEQFRRSKRAFRSFFRRYVVSLLGFPFLKAWRERNIGLARALFFSLVDLCELVIAALSWLELKFLMSTEEQLAYYSTFYSRGSNSHSI